ncbi:MAG: sugar phosphate isomerase/epimerase family protein [Bacillota bacterium]
MKLGVHAYAWCSQWSNDTLDIVDRVKRLGLDFVEIPLMRLDTFDGPAIRRRLRDAGLTAVTSTVLFAHNDITNPDPEVRAKGVDYLKRCVLAASEIDAPFVSGVTYSQHVKPSPTPPTEVEWRYAADALREVARFAQGSGIQVSLEPVNRYESYLVNTSEQAMRLREMVGEPNVKVHLDTYHMNIEEKDLYQATMLAAEHLVHLHLSESDRGIPGTALVHWDDLFRALKEINYQGFAALESFADMTTNMNTWTWRQLAPDSDTLVLQGAQFVRDMMRKHGLK